MAVFHRETDHFEGHPPGDPTPVARRGPEICGSQLTSEREGLAARTQMADSVGDMVGLNCDGMASWVSRS